MKVNKEQARAIGGRIENARAELGLSYTKLAELSGVDYSQVFKICKGRFVSLGGNLWQICHILHVSPLPDDADVKDEQRLTRGVLALWDRTSEGADRIIRMLHSIQDVHGERRD